MVRLAVLLMSLVGCRLGFDEHTPSTDAPHCAAMAGVAQSQPLACDQPMRFQISAACVDQLDAIETGTTIDVFAVDWLDTLTGWSFDPSTGAALAQAVTIATGVGHNVGATDTVDGPVVVSTVGGTATVYALGPTLAARGPASKLSDAPAATPLATTATSVALGTIGSSVFGVRPISTLGAELQPASTIAPAADMPSFGSVVAVGSGFLASWQSAATTPSSVRVALLDPSFALLTTPVDASSATADNHGASKPRIAWAPQPRLVLVTWYQKNASGSDDILMMMLDNTLAPTAPASQLASPAATPAVATDGIDFWIAYQDQKTNKLAVARVPATGMPATVAVSSSGGSPHRWQMISGSGHATLVWTELGGSGADLWIQQLCH